MSAAVVPFHPSADVPRAGASYGENRTSAAVRQISMFARSLSAVGGGEHHHPECIPAGYAGFARETRCARSAPVSACGT